VKSRKDLNDEVTRHQVYLERHAASLSSDMEGSVERVGLSARKRLSDMDDVTMLGADEMEEIVQEIQAGELQNTAEAIDKLIPQLRDLAEFEAGYNTSVLRASTKGAKILALRAAQAKAVAMAKPIAATGELLEPFIQTWSDKTVEAVSSAIRTGYVNGLTNQQIVQSIVGTKSANLRPLRARERQYWRRRRDGIVEMSRRDAQAVVRTSVQHVASAVRMETFAQNSDVVTGYRFVATLDGKTTPQCRSLDGKVFKLGKGPLPPLHVRCRSTTAPEIAEEYAWLKEGGTRSAEDGPVDANLSYYDWLKTQGKSFQDDAIGPKRAQLLRDGGLSSTEFARLNLGRNFEPLTLEEMRRKAPAAFERAGI
jgi:SPP1 gp7 family putative phage head morphogenesis protein